MKKYLVTVILVVLIILTLSYSKFHRTEINIQNQETTTSISKEMKENGSFDIYVYNANNGKIEPKEVKDYKNTKFLSEDEYIKEIIKNSTFLYDNMDLLAVYELDDNSVYIKLSQGFQNLSKSSLEGLKKSIEMTLNKNFPDIKEIKIEIDSNE